MNVNFITLRTTDLERSIEFYSRVLGMNVARRFSPRPGMEIVFMDGGGIEVEFIQSEGPVELPAGISLGFFVSDMDATLAHLGREGVEILSGPDTMPNGVRLLQARDCHGLDLGFVQQP
ncbi:MAG: VOC family protein [Acidobacteriota bacterium]|jgi:lactoylglutathione lyase|nr:VOC family protein [Acidobacteriota bacterium]